MYSKCLNLSCWQTKVSKFDTFGLYCGLQDASFPKKIHCVCPIATDLDLNQYDYKGLVVGL